MKVIEHLDRATEPLFSYEIVPPPRGRTVKDITDIVGAIKKFNPPWIDVTAHSAGAYYKQNPDGSISRRIFKKRPGTIGICGIIQNRFKIDTVTHLLTQGFTKEETEDALIELNFLGITNVFALKGDGLNYNKPVSKDRTHNVYAADLVSQLAEVRHGNYLEEIAHPLPLDFGVGVAGYPEKHFEAPNLAQDIQYLKQKVDAGADYVMCQMFFDNQKYYNYVDQCRAAGISVPIIPGIKIIKSQRQLTTIPRNFYIDFPDELVGMITENPEHAKDIGKEWAMNQTLDLLNHGVPGIHFYIMNDTDTVVDVVKKAQK